MGQAIFCKISIVVSIAPSVLTAHLSQRRIFLIPISPLFSSHFRRSSSSDFLELYFFGYILSRETNTGILTTAMVDNISSDNGDGRCNRFQQCSRDQFDSVCRIMNVAGELWGSCNEMQKQNLHAYFSSWVANRTRVLVKNTV